MIYWWAVSLYAFGCVISASVFFYSLRKGDVLGSTSSLFFYFTIVFFLFRIAWLPIRDADDLSSLGLISHAFNRVAWCLFYSAIVVVVLAWANVLTLRSLSPDTKKCLSGSRCVFCICVLPLYAATAAEIALYGNEQGSPERRAFYNLFIFSFSCLNFLFSVVALFIGALLIRLSLNLNINSANNLRKHSSVQRLTVLAGFITLCFVLRAVLLGYRIWTGNKFPDELFFTLTYAVPELPPLLLQAYLFGLRARTAAMKRERIKPRTKLIEIKRPIDTSSVVTVDDRRSVLSFGERELELQLPSTDKEGAVSIVEARGRTGRLVEDVEAVEIVITRVRSVTLE